VHVVKQTNTQQTGESLIDEFERRHATAHDSFLPAQIVGFDTAAFRFGRGFFLDLAGDPF